MTQTRTFPVKRKVGLTHVHHQTFAPFISFSLSLTHSTSFEIGKLVKKKLSLMRRFNGYLFQYDSPVETQFQVQFSSFDVKRILNFYSKI